MNISPSVLVSAVCNRLNNAVTIRDQVETNTKLRSLRQGLTPALIQNSLLGRKVVAVACGSHHSLCLTQDGDIFSWGQNNCGQIGSGTTTNQST